MGVHRNPYYILQGLQQEDVPEQSFVNERLTKITAIMMAASICGIHFRPRLYRLRPQMLRNPLRPEWSSGGDAPKRVRNFRHRDHRSLEAIFHGMRMKTNRSIQ
jgi:hypothetical protein